MFNLVCFAYDENCNLYFRSYSDTLKCKNIAQNPIVAITTRTLQIHGTSNVMPYGTPAYYEGRKVYDQRFPQYKDVFEFKNNKLYIVKSLVIWNYNPSKGEIHRDVSVFDKAYLSRSMSIYCMPTHVENELSIKPSKSQDVRVSLKFDYKFQGQKVLFINDTNS